LHLRLVPNFGRIQQFEAMSGQPEQVVRTTTYDHVEASIKICRNHLFAKGRFIEYVLFTHIFLPIVTHGSHMIYAPDDAFLSFFKGAKARIGNLRNREKSGTDPKERCRKWIGNNKVFIFIIFLSLIAYKLKGGDIKCGLQRVSFGWANYNSQLTNWSWRFASITGMMIVRLFVSNILPFTSPAFAFLIAKSQAPGPYSGLYGTLYLLGCAMPAGAVVPLLDELCGFLPPWGATYATLSGRKCCGRKVPDREKLDDNAKSDRFDHFFRATRFLSLMTDKLPFSFWVRQAFMQPAWYVTKHGADTTDAHAAAAAVLSGHFMIWAGPATTMYQRLFIPDWVTCIVIQPLGLLEDVAVVLATWAGESGVHTLKAELSLLAFMLCANIVRFIGTYSRSEEHPLHGTQKQVVQHLIVAAVTVAVFVWTYTRLDSESELESESSSTMTTTTTLGDTLCPTTHTDVKAMVTVVMTVTSVAVLARILALVVTSPWKVESGGSCAREISPGDLGVAMLQDIEQ